MDTIRVKLLNDKAQLPQWNNKSAGCDLFSTEFYILKPGERKLFKTGLSMAIPEGLYGRIAPRSGLAFKDGIDVLAGVIDEDYRGEIGVILINLGQTDKNVLVGDKIAQLIFEKYHRFGFLAVGSLDDTARGAGGFGSTDAPKPLILSTTQTNEEFRLLGRTTVEKVFPPDRVDGAKVFFSNFEGELYEYEEKGFRGIAVVDSSGQILTKLNVGKR